MAIAFGHISAQSSTLSYRIEGHVDFSSYSPAGLPSTSLHRDYSVAVNGCQRLITTTNISEKGDVLTSWSVASKNGSEIYCATYYTNGFIMGIVESNAFPSASEDGVSPSLWLMSASECYLNGAKTNQLPPIYDPLCSLLFDKDLKYPVFIDRLKTAPALPNRIVYMNDGFYRTRNAKNDSTQLIKVSPPFDKGFTNGVYSITDTTNIEGLTLPLGFTFTEYGPSMTPEGQPTLLVKKKMVASVKRIELLTATMAFEPSLLRKAVIQDRRLMYTSSPRAEPTTYTVTDGAWKTVEQVRQIMKDKPSHKPRRINWLVRAVLILVVAVPPLLIWYAYGNNKKVQGR